ncbi:MAG: peptidylprolyl isomerase [Pseudomonadota bacterium]|nr:peptidylprolyl isomerase [Pseudomonadota bacterium]
MIKLPYRFDGLPRLTKAWTGAMLLAFATLSSPASAQLLDRVAAVVNDQVILKSTVDRKLDMFKSQLAQDGRPLPPDNMLKERVMDQLVLESVQLQLAKERNIAIDSETINKAINDIAQRNGMDFNGFVASLPSKGMTYAQFREDIRTELTIAKLQQQVVSRRISMTETEIKNFQSKRVDDSSLFLVDTLVIPKSVKGSVKALANSVYKALQNGAEFAYYQNKFAQQQNNAAPQKLAMYPEPLQTVLPELQSGEFAEPVYDADGNAIIARLVQKTEDDTVRYVEIEQYAVRHILLRVDGLEDDEKKREELQSIRQQILDGADFAQLAERFSDDPGSAARGGDLGMVVQGIMVENFENYMFNTPMGEISPVFKTEFGWHILQVTDKEIITKTQDANFQRAQQMLYQQRYQEAQQSWLKEILDNAEISVKPI